ncbi:hypothetical protein L3Y34_002157 [Caenorhabditis briggsae]|uniref:Uncharacterized protein n=1 Tax=Caenorhabditis briggsae TaxID=6238 RepID=A0AAE9IRC2_CAEBR|nr:hypothetical protein L3Y34_002157 [Caenorhabditis briggsae]
MMSVSKVFLYLSPTICTRFGECEHRCLLGKINVTEIEEEGVSTYEERQLIFIAGDIYAGVKDSSFPMMLAVSFVASIRSRRTMIVDGVTSWFTSWYFIAMASIVIVVLIIVGVIFVKFYFERKVVTILLGSLTVTPFILNTTSKILDRATSDESPSGMYKLNPFDKKKTSKRMIMKESYYKLETPAEILLIPLNVLRNLN